DWQQYVRVDERFKRPAEVELLVADPSKAKRELDWEPTVRIRELVRMMVDADLLRHRAGPAPACREGAGHARRRNRLPVALPRAPASWLDRHRDAPRRRTRAGGGLARRADADALAGDQPPPR